MKTKTLKTIKKELRDFLPIIQAMSNHWKNPNYASITVLLQNAGFENSDTCNFDAKKAEEDLYEILNILKLIAEYKNSHFETWVYEEVNRIINTNVSEENTVGFLTN